MFQRLLQLVNYFRSFARYNIYDIYIHEKAFIICYGYKATYNIVTAFISALCYVKAKFNGQFLSTVVNIIIIRTQVCAAAASFYVVAPRFMNLFIDFLRMLRVLRGYFPTPLRHSPHSNPKQVHTSLTRNRTRYSYYLIISLSCCVWVC